MHSGAGETFHRLECIGINLICRPSLNVLSGERASVDEGGHVEILTSRLSCGLTQIKTGQPLPHGRHFCCRWLRLWSLNAESFLDILDQLVGTDQLGKEANRPSLQRTRSNVLARMRKMMGMRCPSAMRRSCKSIPFMPGI